MAAIREIINQVAKANDVPYSWPEQTCVKPVIDFACIVLGRDIELPPILSLSEARASVVIQKDREYKGSWFRLMKHHAALYNYGGGVSLDDLLMGDIVEFTNPHFVFRGSRTGIGIMYSDDWLYSKGEKYIVPIPVCSSEIISAMRLSTCRQL